MKLKLAIFIALATFLTACDKEKTVKVEDNGTKTEITTNGDNKDGTEVNVTGKDGEKVEIKDGKIKVKDGGKEINISKDGISINDDDDDGKNPEDGDKSESDDAGSAEKLTLKGVNENKTVACDGKRVLANGVGNKYTLTGECAAVIVNGTGQNITVDKVGRIRMNGTGNKVIYGEGLDGKEPDIKKAGTGNSVNKK